MTGILESALRAYRLLAPRDELTRMQTIPQIESMSRKFDAWLREHVIPAIEEYWRRPRFRKEASWAQRAFGEGKRTAEWALVRELANALRQSAKDVLAIASAAAQDGDFPTLEAAEMMLSQGANEPYLVSSVTISGSGSSISVTPHATETRRQPSRLKAVDTAIALHQCKNIRTCKAEDLVSPEDYFGPYRDSVAVINGEPATVGKFLQFLNPRQKYVGNHVVRALLARVTTERDSIERARRAAYQQVNPKRRKRLIEREQQSWSRLLELIGQVDNGFLTCTQARIREGCMVLVQIYLAYAPSSVELDWLRLSPVTLGHRRGMVRAQLDGRADFEVTERLYQALDEVRQLYLDSRPDEAEIEEAISLGGLVLVENTRKAYWEGNQIKVDWRTARKPWELLWLLASHGQTRRAVGADDLYPDAPPGSRSTFPNRWRRLKEVLPPRLHRHVVPGDKASYMLDLPRDLICLFPS